MATPTPPNNDFTRDAGGQSTTAQSADKPTSLYRPRAAQQTDATRPSPFASTKTAQSPFSRPAQPNTGSLFSKPSTTGASSIFGQGQSAFSRPAASAQPGTQQKPFTSLRAQTTAQPSTPSPQSRFTRPAADAARPGSLRSDAGQAPKPSFRAEAAPRAASPFRKDLHITDEEFLLLRDFIYQQCGIFIAENRKYLVENRLSNRIKELNLKSYNEYYNFLRFDKNRKEELTKLFEVVTTNETSFFRNPPQLEVFQRIVLSEAIEECRKTGQKKLRIWSAGCSTGEEPYTLAIILHETLRGEIGSWDIKITANDLSEAVLHAARRGTYNEYALRTTPKEMVEKYFKKEGNLYRVDQSLKNLVSFGPINLSDKEQLKRVEKSQIVFCRNVIIYFDDDMKRKVINAFYDNLNPKGVLIIGHSESLHNISRAFQLEHHKGTILYRKSA